MATTSRLLSLRAYARHRGVSHTAVNLAVKAGRIPTVDGKIDPIVADAAWTQNTDQSKPRNSVTGDPKHRRRRGEPPAPASSAGTTTSGASTEGGAPPAGPSYVQSRALREAFMARLTKLEYEEKLGKLVSADEVRVATFNAARKARDMLLALPDRLSPILAAIEDPREVHQLLATELRLVCEEIASASHTR